MSRCQIMCRLFAASNGTEWVSGDGVGKIEVNSVIVKHSRDSVDPPEASC